MLRLRGDWTWYVNEGQVEVGSALAGRRFRLGAAADRWPIELAEALEAGIHGWGAETRLALSMGRASADLESLLSVLRQAGALTSSPRDDLEPTRFERQELFFGYFEHGEDSGKAFSDRFRESSVAVITLGGWGSWDVLLLAMMGVRRIVGVDFDTVDESNLGRQALYDEAQIGVSKVLACKEAVGRLAPGSEFIPVDLRIESKADVIDVLSLGVDLVVAPIGYAFNPVVEATCGAALEMDTPLLLHGASWVGPLTIPGDTPCFWCLTADRRFRSSMEAATASVERREGSPAARRVGGVIAARIAINAGLATWEAAQHLSQAREPRSRSAILAVDSLTYSAPLCIPVQRRRSCTACGDPE